MLLGETGVSEHFEDVTVERYLSDGVPAQRARADESSVVRNRHQDIMHQAQTALDVDTVPQIETCYLPLGKAGG